MFSSNVLAFLALAFVSQTVVAGPSVVPARAGLHSKLARRALKRQRVGDAQNSLQLDPSQIGPNLALTGQEVPAAGQVPSLTSTNNYINFCLTQNTVLTNGKQITTGSCNQTPMGRIIATDKMPVSRFTFPSNGGAIKANTGFTIKMAVVNIDAGHFTNPTTTYYNAPQTVNNNGVGIGHTHCVIEKISAFDTQELTDPRNFAFFKGLNAAADASGQLTADVTGGLPAGFYKLTSINTASNHQPFLVAVAQHGTSDDSIYFEVTADGKPSAANIAANPAGVDTNASASVAATASSTATSVASASISATASVSGSAAATSTASASTSDKAATGKDAATSSAAETKAASTVATSSAAATTSAAADKGTGNKNGKNNGKNASESAVASTAAATSSTPAKGAASSASAKETSKAASSENTKATSSAAKASSVASTASASAASASESAATGNKGKNNN